MPTGTFIFRLSGYRLSILREHFLLWKNTDQSGICVYGMANYVTCSHRWFVGFFMSHWILLSPQSDRWASMFFTTAYLHISAQVNLIT